ncbi:glycosyltransferase [bacterium]|nr:glycosyltransferase [bacterium]
MTDPDLTIVIVNWNGRDLLRACLPTLETTPLCTEIIVVDNCSTDDSLAVLQNEFPGVHVVANPTNAGFAVANNQGMRLARGRYILLLNSDTKVIGDALATLVHFMDENPSVGACSPQLLNEDGTLQPSGRAFPTVGQAMLALLPLPTWLRAATLPRLERRDYSQIHPVDELSGAALCLRRATLDSVGLFDENFYFFGEDVDLCRRLQQDGWGVVYVPTARVFHLWGGSRRQLSQEMSLLSQRAQVLLMRKHRPGPAALVMTVYALLLTVLKAMARTLAALRRQDSAAALQTLRRHLYEARRLLRKGP